MGGGGGRGDDSVSFPLLPLPLLHIVVLETLFTLPNINITSIFRISLL